ncbi:MAG: hypothetical protein HKP55_14405 [Gammaproteobacteria bacterium]|nr:hypothetical protein [Gammaproteobacteria bacterium]
MPDIKRVILSVSTLLFLSQNNALASEYPAPPGHYGQDKILENSTFNTGKGSPYISIIPAGKIHPDNKQETFQKDKTDKKISTAAEPLNKTETKPVQTPNHVLQPLTRAQQTLPAVNPEAMALPIADQAVYSPAPETAPSRFQDQVYPDANDLSHHYKLSRQLPFGQWGEELPETQKQPQYDYPAAQPANRSAYPAAAENRTFRGSPELANKMFNSQENQAPAYNQPTRNNSNTFNSGSFPVDMMDQFWGGRNSAFMPPINSQLKTFDQFPVPQNLYGPSPINQSAQSGNRQFFRQIPKEEIIYPPHYRGRK